MTSSSRWKLRGIRAFVVAGLAGVACAGRTRPARAEATTPYALPAPFVLPELSHPRTDARLDAFLGHLVPAAADRSRRSDAVAAIVRPSVETSAVLPRRLFLGMTYPFAVALPPDGGLAPGEVAQPSGMRALPGNLEAHVRAVFSLPRAALPDARGRPPGLQIGFVLATAFPTASFDRSSRANRSAAQAAMSMDPTSYSDLLPGRFVLRPAGDLRIVRGPFVFQGRHGIDVIVDAQGLGPVMTAGRLAAHFGWLARDDVELSLEASQIYFFSGATGAGSTAASAGAVFDERYRVSDAHRSAIVLGPGLRFALGDVDLGATLVTNVGDPLSPAASNFVALRVSIIAHAP